MDWSEEYDVVVVGSGVAGLSAALSASRAGMRPLLLEKASTLGGGTTYSYGLIWIGLNHLAKAEGIKDELSAVLAYMRFLGGGYQLEERMLALVEHGPRVLELYEKYGLRFRLVKALGDIYHGKVEGASAGGRSVEHDLVPAAELGRWKDLVRRPPVIPSGLLADEMLSWGGLHNVEGWDRAVMAERAAADTRGLGAGLVGGFVKVLDERGVEMRVNAPVGRLVVSDGRVEGVSLENGSRIRARKGVVLATGGYESNDALVANFEGLPRFYSMFPPELTGDGLVMAAENGAAVHLVHHTFRLHLGFCIPAKEGGRPEFRLASIIELCSPHTLVVNREGRRFANEAYFQSVAEAVRAYDVARHDYVNLPCFLIFDRQYVDKFSFAGLPVGGPLPDWIVRADTLAELAGKLGVDPVGLEATVNRFNGFVASGNDDDFGRGTEGWRLDRHTGEAGASRMGKIEGGPFYGIELRPSSPASAGLDTDVHGRVLHQRRQPIPGLYASGNVSAHTEIGVGYQAGLSLAAGMTFSHLAVEHMKGDRRDA